MKPFTELMDLILSPLKSAAAQGAQNLASGIGTTVQLGITLYIILYGWQVARGEIAEPWNEFAKRAVKLGIIVALVQGTGLYQEVVIDFLAGSLPDALSNALSNKPIPDASAFDSLANQIAILLTQVWQGTGWSAPAATARAAVVTLLVMPFLWCALIVGFVVTLWAKAGMYFIATLGPLFIALAMFEQTRKYLYNWLDQIVSMIALQVLVALTCGLVIQGLEKATKTAPTPESIFALAGQVIVLSVFSLAIWSSLPRLASKLGGYGANLAGAGSRAAPLDTIRAPLGSFNEHGAPPAGRPELATITPRGGDTRPAAPIMPPPVVAADGRPGEVPPTPQSPVARGVAPANAPAARSERQAATRTVEAAASVRSTDASPSSAPFAPSVLHSGLGAFAIGTAINTSDVRAGNPSAAPISSAETPPASSFSSLSSTAAWSAAAPLSTPQNVDFDTMLAEQRTGFEGMNFEDTAPPGPDNRSISAPPPLPAATQEAPLSAAAPADAVPTITSTTDRRPL
jgi:type IV secretion system protein VirB6